MAMVVLRRIDIKRVFKGYEINYGKYKAIITKEGNEYRLELYEQDLTQKDAMSLVHDEHFKTLKEAIFAAGMLMRG